MTGPGAQLGMKEKVELRPAPPAPPPLPPAIKERLNDMLGSVDLAALAREELRYWRTLREDKELPIATAKAMLCSLHDQLSNSFSMMPEKEFE